MNSPTAPRTSRSPARELLAACNDPSGPDHEGTGVGTAPLLLAAPGAGKAAGA